MAQSAVAVTQFLATGIAHIMSSTMKRFLTLIALLGLAVAASAEVQTFKIDPVHSSAGFSVRHLFSKFPGSFTKITGAIVYDDANPAASSVEASIDLASLNTANEKREADLKEPSFFDAVKFPTITFKSKSWTKTGADTFDVKGDLTMKGVSKEITLKVTLLGIGAGMGPGAVASGWEAATVLHKSDYGVTGPTGLGKVLGDEVTVSIAVEAKYKKDQPAPAAAPAKQG